MVVYVYVFISSKEMYTKEAATLQSRPKIVTKRCGQQTVSLQPLHLHVLLIVIYEKCLASLHSKVFHYFTPSGRLSKRNERVSIFISIYSGTESYL